MSEAAATICSGEHALALIQRHHQRLARLQVQVLADRDPEDLHQLRVSLRRLRTALAQFAPALVLPPGVGSARLAKVARSTGWTRDLDVLRERLERILPELPESERRFLRPALRGLQRERAKALVVLQRGLRSRRHQRVLERLESWQQDPVYTPLGQQPLELWLQDWLTPVSAGLFLHPGWFAADPRQPALHELRKRLKALRYGLEHLAQPLGGVADGWITLLRDGQGCLGELHDLEVLEERLLVGSRADRRAELAGLRLHLREQRQRCWCIWQGLAARWLRPQTRRALMALETPPAGA